MLPGIFDRDVARTPRPFSNMLDGFINDALKSGELSRFSPSVDIAETDNSYEMKVEVPGMKKEDFNIEVDGDLLQVSGERKWEKEDSSKTYHRVESQYGSFTRTFRLPEDGQADKIEASYNDGVLKVTIPRDEKKRSSKKVQIK